MTGTVITPERMSGFVVESSITLLLWMVRGTMEPGRRRGCDGCRIRPTTRGALCRSRLRAFTGCGEGAQARKIGDDDRLPVDHVDEAFRLKLLEGTGHRL